MKIKKIQLFEIIDSNGELIGRNDVPSTGADLESGANGTTDMNVGKGQQPFRYDMLGRFGFTLLPFFEGKEDQGQKELLKDLAQLMHDKRIDILKYYYKNPQLLKPDYRKEAAGEPHFEKAFKEPIDEVDSINEDKIIEDNVAEDKLVDKRGEDEISQKAEDNDIKDKKLEKIAGLISKLDQKDKDKLTNLLERR